jgi:hypothetical protein
MSPRHFYRAAYPKQAALDDIGLHNAFVAFTHAIGLSKYFSYVPEEIVDHMYPNLFPLEVKDNPVKDPAGELPGDQTSPDTNNPL